ncbi:MAG TPA: methyltransferase domain-containing protein [Candidatus Dormibacteraeota bacterium]|nr:methyltransferase domain-containing protein [Candidatus Dormibacteraeota bacterium]
MKSKELYPQVFSRHAEAYKRRLDDIMARGEARGRLRMIELAGARPGMTVLDLACGPGNMTRLLASRVQPSGRVIGVDLARGMIDLARHEQPRRVWFAVMDIERLGLSDGAFDSVVCGHGLQFAPHLGRALREARRVLRPAGVLAASVPAPARDDSVWKLVDRVVDSRLPPGPKAVDDAATRATVNDPDAFRAAALEAGFASASVEVVEEQVVWQSAAELVSMFMGWWQCASRLETMDPAFRQSFLAEATAAVSRVYPGVITTYGRNHVLHAIAA